jgi:TonB family protein
MKIRIWIAASAVFHILVGAAYTFTIQIKPRAFDDSKYVEINHAPEHRITLAQMDDTSDEGAKKKKPVIETNKPPVPVQDVTSDAVGTDTNIVPEDPGYVSFSVAEVLPEALTPIEPSYPEEARRQGIEGRVVMQIYIDKTGVVRNVEILKTPGQALSDAAMKSVTATRFSPARVNGEVRAVCMQFSLRFHLE